MDTQTVEKPQTEIGIISKNINTGLATFEARKVVLIELAKQAIGLKIESIDDKESIDKVSTIRKAIKRARVEIQHEGKSMRDPLTQMNKVILEKEKALIELVEPTEIELIEQEQWLKNELESIEQAKIDAENERIQDRAGKLKEYGFELPYNDLKTITDETFEITLKAAKEEYEKEQAEIAEQERLRIEQEENDRKERELAQKKLEGERKELEELRAKQLEAQKVIDDNNKIIQVEQEENQRVLDAQNAELEANKLAIAKEKQDLIDAKQAEIDKQRRAKELKEATEKAAEKARLQAIEDAKQAEIERLEKQAKDLQEQKEKEARQPDKKKLEKYIIDLKLVDVPELKTKAAKDVMVKIQELITKIDTFATALTNKL